MRLELGTELRVGGEGRNDFIFILQLAGQTGWFPVSVGIISYRHLHHRPMRSLGCLQLMSYPIRGPGSELTDSSGSVDSEVIEKLEEIKSICYRRSN